MAKNTFKNAFVEKILFGKKKRKPEVR